jgi:hypothetical protein
MGSGFFHRLGPSVLVAAGLGLAACNAVYTDVKTAPEASVSSLGGEGIVFLSMAVKDEGLINYDGFDLWYRNTETKKVGSIKLYTGIVAGGVKVLAFEDGNGKGDLKSLTLPAGSYEFHNYWVSTSTSSWRALEDFSIPFTVTAGKATYLGEVRMLRRFEKILLIKTHAGGRFEIRDMSARDVPLFRAEFKDVDPAAIVISPMRSGTVPADLVTFH